jgi:hypothetical protein
MICHLFSLLYKFITSLITEQNDMKKRVITGALLGAILLPFNPGLEAQTVVFDEEIYWEWPTAGNIYGGYGFYWWHRLDGVTMPNYGDMPSDDWYSPDNYYNGEFRMRFEVLEQPTSEPFYIQFGIWQDHDLGEDHLEIVANRESISSAAVFDASLGEPSTWWRYNGKEVDFSRPEDFYRMGIVLWNQDPLCIPKGADWGDGCPEYANKFFPMRARVTITAYPGSGGPVIYPPNYSIDYGNERTNKVVSSSDQYSLNDADWVDGTNEYLGLTPGEDVYFRKREDWSKRQTLDVPTRPGTPSFGIDYINEQTSETVSSSFEYSDQSNMSGATTGSDDYVQLSPGYNIYFRIAATSSSFCSATQELEVPQRPPAPVFSIDYVNERTGQVLADTYEYSGSADMSDPVTGPNDYVDIVPGTTLFIRSKATSSGFKSAMQQLPAPDRPETPAYSIDFTSETTTTMVDRDVEYSVHEDMSDAAGGDSSRVQVIPGDTLWFRMKATDSSFVSGISSLSAPDRPSAPFYAIDFINETTTTPIVVTDEFAFNLQMNGATAGDNTLLPLTPGTDIYLRTRATDSSFSSHILPLAVPDRPPAPEFGIDYEAEMTAEAISNDFIYAFSADMADALDGNGTRVPVTPDSELHIRKKAAETYFSSDIQSIILSPRPGKPAIGIDYAEETTSDIVTAGMEYSQYSTFHPSATGTGQKIVISPGDDLFFREMATMENFSSEIQELAAPLRPAITSGEPDTTEMSTFKVTIIFFQPVSNLTVSGISASNASVDDVQLISALETSTVYNASVTPVADGTVNLQLQANAVAEGNFQSEAYELFYKSGTSGTETYGPAESLSLYPNPTTGKIWVTSPLLGRPNLTLGVYSLTGQLLYAEQPGEDDLELNLDLGHLGQGVYLLKLSSDSSGITRKLIIQGN